MEIWAIVSELSEKELFEKYPDVISRYTPFVLLSIEQGKVIDESYRNTHKYEMRCKRTYDLAAIHSAIHLLPECAKRA